MVGRFPVDVEKFLNVFYDIVDQVEHLLRSEKTKGKGDFEVQYRPWNQRKPTHPMYTREEQLCVISFVRSWYIQQIILKRRCFFSTLKKEGGLGVLQKMLLIQDLRDQSSMDGYAMGFKDLKDRLMVGDSLTLRPEFETAQLLNVSETMVSGENLDTTYIAKLEELSNRWPRFIIVLKYWVTVKTLTDDDRQKKRARADNLSPTEKEFLMKVVPGEDIGDTNGKLTPLMTTYLDLYHEFMRNTPTLTRRKCAIVSPLSRQPEYQ